MDVASILTKKSIGWLFVIRRDSAPQPLADTDFCVKWNHVAFKWPCSSHIQSCSATCRGCSPPSQVIELHPEILEGHLWFSRSPPRTSGGLSMACVVYSQPSRAQKGTQNLCRAFYLWRLFWSMHASEKGFRVFGNAVLEHLKAFLWPVETAQPLCASERLPKSLVATGPDIPGGFSEQPLEAL